MSFFSTAPGSQMRASDFDAFTVSAGDEAAPRGDRLARDLFDSDGFSARRAAPLTAETSAKHFQDTAVRPPRAAAPADAAGYAAREQPGRARAAGEGFRVVAEPRGRAGGSAGVPTHGGRRNQQRLHQDFKALSKEQRKSLVETEAAQSDLLARTVHLRFLPTRMLQSELAALCSSCGPYLRVRICGNSTSNQNWIYGFIEFETRDGACNMMRKSGMELSNGPGRPPLRLKCTCAKQPIVDRVFHDADPASSTPCIFGVGTFASRSIKDALDSYFNLKAKEAAQQQQQQQEPVERAEARARAGDATHRTPEIDAADEEAAADAPPPFYLLPATPSAASIRLSPHAKAFQPQATATAGDTLPSPSDGSDMADPTACVTPTFRVCAADGPQDYGAFSTETAAPLVATGHAKHFLSSHYAAGSAFAPPTSQTPPIGPAAGRTFFAAGTAEGARGASLPSVLQLPASSAVNGVWCAEAAPGHSAAAEVPAQVPGYAPWAVASCFAGASDSESVQGTAAAPGDRVDDCELLMHRRSPLADTLPLLPAPVPVTATTSETTATATEVTGCQLSLTLQAMMNSSDLRAQKACVDAEEILQRARALLLVGLRQAQTYSRSECEGFFDAVGSLRSLLELLEKNEAALPSPSAGNGSLTSSASGTAGTAPVAATGTAAAAAAGQSSALGLSSTEFFLTTEGEASRRRLLCLGERAVQLLLVGNLLLALLYLRRRYFLDALPFIHAIVKSINMLPTARLERPARKASQSSERSGAKTVGALAAHGLAVGPADGAAPGSTAVAEENVYSFFDHTADDLLRAVLSSLSEDDDTAQGVDAGAAAPRAAHSCTLAAQCDCSFSAGLDGAQSTGSQPRETPGLCSSTSSGSSSSRRASAPVDGEELLYQHHRAFQAFVLDVLLAVGVALEDEQPLVSRSTYALAAGRARDVLGVESALLNKVLNGQDGAWHDVEVSSEDSNGSARSTAASSRPRSPVNVRLSDVLPHIARGLRQERGEEKDMTAFPKVFFGALDVDAVSLAGEAEFWRASLPPLHIVRVFSSKE